MGEIDYESHTFYREEIDENLVPDSILECLEETIQTESASYIDVEEDYYLVIHVETNNVEPYEVCLVNGEVDKHFLDGVE